MAHTRVGVCLCLYWQHFPFIVLAGTLVPHRDVKILSKLCDELFDDKLDFYFNAHADFETAR